MAWNFFKLVFLFILVGVFNFQTTEAEDPTYVTHDCQEDGTTANSAYQGNLKTLLSSLSSKATVNTFYNNTVGGRNAPNPVYGLFMCRGDVPFQLCGQCVLNATQTLYSMCNLSTSAIIWYDECMVRYSNSSLFPSKGIPILVYETVTINVSNQASFMPLLGHTLNKTADEAAFSPTGDMYATKEAKVSENQTLYCLAQCTRDLSPQHCRTCLANLTELLPRCCEGKQRGRVLSPSCNFRYELYPFYRVNAPGQGGLVPATNYLEIDSKYSQDPGYLSHNCSSDGDGFWQQDIRTLLSYLSSNAISSSDNGFHKTDVYNTVFGLYMCRGDIPPHLCGQCVVSAIHLIASECPSSVEAIIWYNYCLLLYSNHTLSSRMGTSPKFDMLNVTSVSDDKSSFKFLLSNALVKVASEADDDKYWTKSFVLNDNQTLYILAQCTPDLYISDCRDCMYDAIESAIPWSRLGSVGGRVLYPSCTMRFELFQFYRNDTEDQTPPSRPSSLPPPPPSGKVSTQIICEFYIDTRVHGTKIFRIFFVLFFILFPSLYFQLKC